MTTKLGPHIILATESAKRWAANAPIVVWAFRPPANFNLLSGEAIQEMRLQALPPAHVPVVLSAARPGAITICRPIWMLTWDGRQAAEHILALYRQWGFRPTYTQLWNEFDEWGRDELRERLRQGRIAGDILRAQGCKVGDNIASTGTLEEWEWRIAAEEGFGGMDGLMLHEYWGREGFTTWHALRYRRMHDILNGNHPPVIITETGRDRVEGGNGGWKLDGISAEQYVVELKAYDAELQKDSYVLGATPFTSGPSHDWGNYNMDGLEQYLIEEEPNMMWKDKLPRSYQAFKAEGGTDESFESIIQTWVDAGGDVEESALRYLVGTRRLKATRTRIGYLAEKGKSAFQELNDAVSPHLPLA